MSRADSRSDLMALADRYEQGTRKAVESGYYEFGPEFQREREMIVSALRLAASQPDREALAMTVQQFWQGPSGRAWDGGDKSCCVALPEQADWFRRLADAILSLLSGAGAKSDGGVEGHARMDACGLSDDSLRGGANSSNERGGAGIKPGPSDPSPGPYDGEMVVPARLLHALWCYGNLYPVTGVIYSFGSHQECLAQVDALFRKRAALTRPLGGFVQGSIADGGQCNEQSGKQLSPASGGCPRCGAALGRRPIFLGKNDEGHICDTCWSNDRLDEEYQAAGKRPVPSVSGNTDREQQRDTMDGGLSVDDLETMLDEHEADLLSQINTPPATPAGLGAEKLRELASCLDRALGDTDPSINPDYTDDEIKRDYPVFWVCQQLNAILALLSRAGDQK